MGPFAVGPGVSRARVGTLRVRSHRILRRENIRERDGNKRIEEACNTTVMASRSLRPDVTSTWRTEITAQTIGADTMIHCVGYLPDYGSVTGSVFKPA